MGCLACLGDRVLTMNPNVPRPFLHVIPHLSLLPCRLSSNKGKRCHVCESNFWKRVHEDAIMCLYRERAPGTSTHCVKTHVHTCAFRHIQMLPLRYPRVMKSAVYWSKRLLFTLQTTNLKLICLLDT